VTDPVLQIVDLGAQWPTIDPFLFCVHHDDAFPAGDGHLGPGPALGGRRLGSDFSGLDGWSMYHGTQVPGFPRHPHRGFETVTFVRRGLVDHADSLGAAARYGRGDVQWMTAGAGIVHAEMFPLLRQDAPNPLELFQIWVNLPAARKMEPPHFAMLWAEAIPHRVFHDAAGAVTEVACIAGALPGAPPPPAPPPASWAARDDADFAIWTLRLAPTARWTLPAARGGATTRRKLYCFAGSGVSIAGQPIDRRAGVELRADTAVELVNHGAGSAEFLLLQARPIGEPVAQHGPFVMNTQAELRQAYDDFQRSGFGGWPWPHSAPVHGGPEQGRFARDAGGRVETPPPG
jgi:redox-sensitive bicupin YhaK (pirin superfamily)